jgi:hypothetical protein
MARITSVYIKMVGHICEHMTGYRAVELQFHESTPDLFTGLMDKASDQMPPTERLEDKIIHAYPKLKFRANERRQRRKHGN